MTLVTRSRPGGHRAAKGRSWLGLALALIVLVGLIVGGAVYWTGRGTDKAAASGGDVQAGNQDAACGERRFSIAADPRIAATVRQVVSSLPPDACISVGVRAATSADVAADVARAEGKGLGGTLPDAWIPDSSLWLDIAGASEEGQQRLDGDGTSLASSPVVLATTPDIAGQLGGGSPDWQSTLETGSPVTLALPALDRDAATLTSLPALEGSRSLAELARLVAAPPLPEGEPLTLVLSGAADVVPSTEQEVAAASGDGKQVVAIYDETFGALDFPLVRVRPLDAQDDPAADALFDNVAKALTGEAGQSALGKAAFRTPDGSAPAAAPTAQGVDFATAMGAVATDVTALDDARTQWSTQGRRARLLLLMDLSGSMQERLPDGRTRAEAAQDALRGLVEGASPDDALGLWGFTNLVGNGDYEVLLPAEPLDNTVDGVSLRDRFLSEVDQLAPVTGGSTSLYDTVAAAYAAASDNYVDGRFNAVVVVTDGRNEDPGSLTLPALLDDVRRQFDGTRPVRIITIAYGEDADQATLTSIADATAGRSYRALTGDEVQTRLADLLAEK